MVGKLEKSNCPQDESEENPEIDPSRFLHWLLPRDCGCYGDANAYCRSERADGENIQELCHPAKQGSDDNGNEHHPENYGAGAKRWARCG